MAGASLDRLREGGYSIGNRNSLNPAVVDVVVISVSDSISTYEERQKKADSLYGQLVKGLEKERGKGHLKPVEER